MEAIITGNFSTGFGISSLVGPFAAYSAAEDFAEANRDDCEEWEILSCESPSDANRPDQNDSGREPGSRQR